jgi:hypothetical protein
MVDNGEPDNSITELLRIPHASKGTIRQKIIHGYNVLTKCQFLAMYVYHRNFEAKIEKVLEFVKATHADPIYI